MAKVTSKLQVTIPKALAERYSIRPGDEIQWMAAGDAIRVVPGSAPSSLRTDRSFRLRIFDQATERQRRRTAKAKVSARRAGRGWTREELYTRGRSR
jgi:bifunctional DNA-binding transcriptional regulator/antitoxin component of YhaV-PrlF toxin-antitoxin module